MVKNGPLITSKSLHQQKGEEEVIGEEESDASYPKAKETSRYVLFTSSTISDLVQKNFNRQQTHDPLTAVNL